MVSLSGVGRWVVMRRGLNGQVRMISRPAQVSPPQAILSHALSRRIYQFFLVTSSMCDVARWSVT